MNLAVVTYGLPLLSRQNTNSSHLLLIRARHTGGDRLALEEKLCSLSMVNFSDTGAPPSDLVHVTIPLAFLQAMPIVRHGLELAAADPGDPFVTDESLELRGCSLSDPQSDPLPDRHDVAADPDDPRLWDQDRDGKPGLTTLTDGVLRGEIYIAQRMRLALAGQLVGPDRIAGHVLVQTEERILGSSKASLVYDISTEIHADPDRTWFAMQRLAPDASCADLIRMADRAGSFLAHRDRLGDPTAD
jgi:hypothetical protein